MSVPFSLFFSCQVIGNFYIGVGNSGIKKQQHCFLVSHRSHGKEAGHVLSFGMGDVGQLGLGEDILERKKPALVALPEKIVQVVAGGMHTVCLSDTGNVRDSSLFLATCVSHSCHAHTITRAQSTRRFTLSAVMTRAPWVGPRLGKAPSRSQARWRWTSR